MDKPKLVSWDEVIEAWNTLHEHDLTGAQVHDSGRSWMRTDGGFRHSDEGGAQGRIKSGLRNAVKQA